MIYRSNLVAPDLLPHFHHTQLVDQPQALGHSVITHWTDKPDTEEWRNWKKCGSLTHDEAAILYHIAKAARYDLWLDIGANVGWSTAHIAEAGQSIWAVDPQFLDLEWLERFNENTYSLWGWRMRTIWQTSRAFFPCVDAVRFGGVMIDGDHSWGEPLHDAQQAAAHLEPGGVIVFHDFIGGPVREGVLWLMDQGFHCRVYETPHMMAACWRGDNFVPPDHTPDPHLAQYDLRGRCEGFPFERTV